MILGFGFAGQRARATDSPKEPCSLLTAAQATDLHTRLKTLFYGKDSTPASVGDEAYVDKGDAIHVRKGNVRYFLTISHGDTPSGRKQILALAALVAGEL
jgi:hypothetical protein